MKWAGLALLVALLMGVVSSALPPPAMDLPAPAGELVRGAIHIHTRRSDGAGTVEDVARAAGRAGLKFVIITDHGDATRAPAPPRFQDGVLCIDAVEISTHGGHVVALGLPRAPYPLAGEARDVLEDIARLGGMAIAAHPGSPKTTLRWTDWTTPLDGIEWLNGDSEWRDEPPRRLLTALLTYPIRRAETIAALFDRQDAVLARWDALSSRAPVVAVAAGDAHARLALRDVGDPYDSASSIHVPWYEQIFRALSVTVTGVELTGDASADALAILQAIRAGHVYSAIDGLARPGFLSFTARSGERRATGGDTLVPNGQIEFVVESNAPNGARIVLLRNGEIVGTQEGRRLRRLAAGEPGTFRVEVHLSDRDGTTVPWMLSNPIYVRDRSADAGSLGPVPPAPQETARQYSDGPATGWTVEHSERSRGALDVVPALDGTQLLLRFGLGGTASDSPYVAAVMPGVSEISHFDRLVFRGRAARPMRVSIQLRMAGAEARRWARSVYLDEQAREIAVRFDELTQQGSVAGAPLDLSQVRDILFVVATDNNLIGSTGQLWLDDIRYAR